MPAGIEVRNLNTSIVIDAEYRPLIVKQAVVLTPASLPYTARDTGCRISRVGFFTDGHIEHAIIATRCIGGYATCVGRQFYTDSGTGLPAVYFDLAVWGGMSCEFYYITPQPPDSLVSGAPGPVLHIFDENRNVIFDSNNNVARIVAISDIVGGTMFGSNWSNGGLFAGGTVCAVETGTTKKYAAIVSLSRRIVAGETGATNCSIYLEAATVTPTGASGRAQARGSYSQNGLGAAFGAWGQSQIALVDVTGILP